jgi:hypothetical protein
MKRLIPEPVPEEHYDADACVVWCFDDRFTNLYTSFYRHEEFAHIDMVKVAGGAKGLASPAEQTEQAYLLDQIEKSLKLHHPPLIVLMVHAGCGAYGKQFPSKDEETEFYKAELEKAETTVNNFLAEKGKSAKILKYYADFGGLWELD